MRTQKHNSIRHASSPLPSSSCPSLSIRNSLGGGGRRLVGGIKPITQSAYKTVNTFILFSIVTNSILAGVMTRGEENDSGKVLYCYPQQCRDNTLFPRASKTS